jgi:MFS transporter, DHA1 family, tetracycline resistance protein
MLLTLPIVSCLMLPQSSTTSQLSLVQRSPTAPMSTRKQFNAFARVSSNMAASDAANANEDPPRPAKNYNWSIAALLASAFLNLLGFTMAGPITPALGLHFDLQVGTSFGSITSAYPLGMLFGLFLWPTLSDKWGRPPVMTLSLLGTGLGLAAQAYVIASKKNLWVFLLSRVITGSFAGSSPISKAYLADVSADNLPRNLAWRDAASTLAFLVGPLLGGVFLGSTASLSFVIAISSVASLLAALVVGLLVQESEVTGIWKKKNSENSVQSQNDGAGNLLSCPLGTSLWSGVATVCLISFLFNVGDSTFHAFFSALLKTRNVSPSNIGLVYSSLAAISLAFSTIGTERVVKSFGPVASCAIGLTAVGTGLLALGSASHVWAVVAAAAMYYCGVPLYSPTIPTMLLRCVPPNRRGFILGFDGAINTVARIVAPLVMGHLYQTRGSSAAFGLAGKAVLIAATTAMAKRVYVMRQQQKTTLQTKLQ